MIQQVAARKLNFSADDLSLIAVIPVGGDSSAVRLSMDGTLAFVAVNNSPGQTAVVDTDPTSPTYHTVIETITLSGNGSSGLGVHPDGTTAYGLTQRPAPGTVSAIDTSSLSITGTLTPSGGGDSIVDDVVFSPDGEKGYVSLSQSLPENNIGVFSAATHTYTHSIDLTLTYEGGGPSTMVVAAIFGSLPFRRRSIFGSSPLPGEASLLP